MPLTPLDIHNKEFSRGFRGYREEEVDLFLDDVVREFETLLKENAALRERLEALSSKVEQYRELEDTLHNTLIIAQETAEEVKASARKEAELVVREAEEAARELRRKAQSRLRELGEAYDELRKDMRLFRARVKGELAAQIELIDEHIRASENDRSLEELVSLQTAVSLETATDETEVSQEDTIELPERPEDNKQQL